MKTKVIENHTLYILSYRRGKEERTVAFGDIPSALQRVEEISFDKSCKNLKFKKRVTTVVESDVAYSDVGQPAASPVRKKSASQVRKKNARSKNKPRID